MHEVVLDAFWIDRTEVRNAQFAVFVEDTGYGTTAEEQGSGWAFVDDGWEDKAGTDWRHPRGPASDLDGLADHPVVLVSWEDADAYCDWAEARLPTEAEWEYAVRGPEGLIYPWGDEFEGEKANYCNANCPKSFADGEVDDGYALTAPAGSFAAGASWAGALDMAGNVFEWVNDWYDDDHYATLPRRNPQGPDSGDDKVLRGGGVVDQCLLAARRGPLRRRPRCRERRYRVPLCCCARQLNAERGVGSGE